MTTEKRRLSECIRAGAAKRPQGFGDMFADSVHGIHSCALGAAYEGSTGYYVLRNQVPLLCNELRVMFPILNRMVSYDGISSDPLATEIIYLNDARRLTREQIADFVESIEAEEAAKEMQLDPEPVLQH